MHTHAAHALIEQCYRKTHAACARPAFADFKARHVQGEIAATLGYRRADRERLFLEAYLDVPINVALRQCLGREFARRDIVEIGNLASENALAMIGLWAQAANDLGADAEVAVAVLTAPLRSMFHRLGLTLHEIAPARAERLGANADDWGNYYALDPVVCAGFIAEGQQCLARHRRVRRAAA